MKAPGGADRWVTGLVHGDKGVWKLMDAHGDELAEVPMDGPVPLDVDTWDDYRRVLLAAAGV